MIDFTNKFYIINDVDRPCGGLVVQRTFGNKGEYCHYAMRTWNKRNGVFRLTDEAMPMECFGFQMTLIPGPIEFKQLSAANAVGFVRTDRSVAKYKNGDTREWQGADSFILPLIPCDWAENKEDA